MPFFRKIINAQTGTPEFAGNIYIGGNFTSCNSNLTSIAKLEADGSSSSGFGLLDFGYYAINTISIQDDNKIILGGDIPANPNNTYTQGILRLNTDGSLDINFRSSYRGYLGTIYDTKILSNGKIVVAGTIYNNPHNHVQLLNSDGNLDSSMNIGLGNTARSIFIQDDGKILIAGEFTSLSTPSYSYGSVSLWRIIRLNSNYTLDTSFLIQKGVNNTVYAINQDNDYVAAYGSFTQANNFPSQPTFSYSVYRAISYSKSSGYVSIIGDSNSFGGVNGDIYTADYNSTHAILGGNFTSWYRQSGATGGNLNRIIKINRSNNTTDTSFNIGSGFNGAVYAVKIQSDEKILVGGAFTTYNGVSRPYIARLEADGSLDTTFTPSVNNTIRAIAITE